MAGPHRHRIDDREGSNLRRREDAVTHNSHPDPKRKRTGLCTRLSCKIEDFPTPDQADLSAAFDTSQATNGFALA
jgi:hypothetical protein